MRRTEKKDSQSNSKLLPLQIPGSKYKYTLQIEDLTGVHDPVRIERGLDLLHHSNSIETQLINERTLLTKTNTVFAL